MGNKVHGLLSMYAQLSMAAVEFTPEVPVDETTPLNANGGDDQTRELDLDKMQEEGLELLLDDDSEGEALLAEGEQIDRAVDGLVAMETFLGQVKSPIGDVALGCVQTALEALHKTLGLEDQTSPILAVEGYDRVATCQRNWSAAHESMNTTVKAAGVRVGEWIKRFFLWLGDQFEGMFHRAESYAKIARAVVKEARAVDTKGAPSQGSIGSLELMRFFSRGGAVMAPEEISLRYQRYMAENNSDLGQWTMNETLKVLSDQGDADRTHSTTATVINSVHAKVFGKFNRTNTKEPGGGTVWERELPFGSRYMDLIVVQDELQRPTAIQTRLVGRDQVNFDANQKLRAMPIANVIQLAIAIETNMVAGYYRERTRLKGQMRKVEYLLERMAQSDTIRARHLQSTKNLVAELMSYLRTSYNYDLTVTRRLLDYAWSSVKAHQS